MFKRFLKFLRGDEDAINEPFEGSYLDHLLVKIRPDAEAQLRECPEHDPVLLVVVGIFQATMLNAFQPEIRTPLTDRVSAGPKPPPPPGSADVTNEIPADEINAGFESSKKQRITEKFDANEIQSALAAEESEPVTGEIEVLVAENIRDVDVTSELVRPSDEPDSRPRLDDEPILRAGRIFLEVLIENDRLPTELQLSVNELFSIRDMLISQQLGSEEHGEAVRRLLALVEQKFNEGLFGQARILLALFQTDDQTQLNNDRNLFYEEMILKLGIKRRHRLTEEETKAFQTLADASDDPGRRDALSWLKTNCAVRFHVLLSDESAADYWREFSSISSIAERAQAFDERLPVVRWREVSAIENETVTAQVKRYLTVDAVRAHLTSQLAAAYFVLRAVGDTGLEPVLDTFFDWTEKEFGVNATAVMPELYKRSMSDQAPMTEILHELYVEHFGDSIEALVENFNDETVENAVAKVLANLKTIDLGEIAPGDYNLGAFVLDVLLDVPYPSPDFSFKIHRLT